MKHLNKFSLSLVLVAISFIWVRASIDIPDSLLVNANAVVLEDYTQVDHTTTDRYVVKYSRSTKILNKKGSKHCNINIHYKESSDKLSDVKIIILNSNNEIIREVKSKDLENYSSGDGYSIITDYKVKHFDYSPSSYPVTIQYSYKIVSKNTLSLPFWNPIKGFNIAVIKSEYDLNSPQNVRVKLHNFKQYQSIDHKKNYFKMINQKALTKEKYSPAEKEIFPVGIFNPSIFTYENRPGKYHTWKGYGKWIHDQFLNHQFTHKIKALKNEIENIISPEDSKRQISEKIYKYVQENTRYVSISLEEGGLKPMSPYKVHEVKYGDCKALSLYTKVLLNLFDIEANYIEVCAGSESKLNLFRDYPSAYPGNHIIINIPLGSDTCWIDCTSNNNPFNYLGQFTDDRLALSISQSGGTLVKTPKYSAGDNQSLDSITIQILENGSATLSMTTKNSGIKIDNDLHLKNSDQKSKEQYLTEDLLDIINIKKLTKSQLAFSKSEPESFWDIEAQLENFSEAAGNYLFIPHQIKPLGIPVLPKDKRRKNKIIFNRGHESIQKIKITLTDDYKLIEDLSLSVESPYGSYKTSFSMENNNQIIITKQFTLNEGQYPKEEYKKIKSFFNQCLKTERKPITISTL